MADLAPGGGSAADEDGGSRHEAHLPGCGVQLHKAVALGVHQNAHSAQHRRQGGSHDPHFIHIDTGRLGKPGVVAHRLHGNAGPAPGEQPHQPAAQRHKQQQSRRYEEITDAEGQEVVQQLLEVGGIQTDGVSQAGAQRPAELQGFEGQHQPGDAHQGHDGEAHIGGDGHFLALQPVQQLSVQVAADGGDDTAHGNGEQEAQPAGDPQLDGQQAADQAGNQTDGQAQVQADAALDAGNHGKNHNGVHAHTHHGVAQQGGQGQIVPQAHEAQQHKEHADDDSGNAQLIHQQLIEGYQTCGEQQGKTCIDQVIAVADQIAAEAALFSALLQIPVVLGIKGISLLIHHRPHGSFQSLQGIVIQNGIQLFQLGTHHIVGLGRLSLCPQHCIRGDKSGHIHLRLVIFRDLLTGGQHFLVTLFHGGNCLVIVIIPVSLLGSFFDAAVGAQQFVIPGGGCFQFRGCRHAGGKFGICVLGAGVFLRLGNGLTDSSHSGVFRLGLFLGLLLGDVDVAFHNALAGDIQQSPGAQVVEDGLPRLGVLFGQVHRPYQDQRHTGKAQHSGNGASYFTCCHCA